MPYCRHCGSQVEADDRFCESCGLARARAPRAVSSGTTGPAVAKPAEAAPRAARPAPPVRVPPIAVADANGMVACPDCGVRVPQQKVDNHQQRNHRTPNRPPPDQAAMDLPSAGTAMSGSAPQADIIRCGDCATQMHRVYYKRHAQRVHGRQVGEDGRPPNQPNSPGISQEPGERSSPYKRAGWALLSFVGAYIGLGALLQLVIAGVTLDRDAQAYGPVVGLVLGIISAVIVWMKT